MEYTIVPMGEGHLDQVEELERTIFSSEAWSRRLLEEVRTIEGAVALCAEAGDGTVLGYASAQIILDEGHINNMAVRPQNRRQGIGSALLEALRRKALEKHLIFLTLEVRASNLGAQALYRKHGYAAVGRRKHYYDFPREDAILMTLEFEYEPESDEPGGVGTGL